MTPTADPSLPVYGPRTEQLREPLGVGEQHPRLSWKLRNERRGPAQSAYRITAAERADDLDTSSRLLWDSGRRESGETPLVPWNGAALRSATRYHWRVGVWEAYRELLLRPLPGGRLTWARAEQETARGRAECGWALADGRLTITAVVPPGATALLEVPTSEPSGVREGGEPAAIRPGVLAVEPADTGALLHLASGHYVVSAEAPDTQTPPVNSRPVLFSRETL